jgi:hypothetical protein
MMVDIIHNTCLTKGNPKRTLKDPWLGQSTNNIPRNTVPSLLVLSLPYMVVHVMAEGAIVSHGPVPICPMLVRCC